MMTNSCQNAPGPIAVTMGCPAGIGPEIIIKASKDQKILSRIVAVGDLNILERARSILKSRLYIKRWQPGKPLREGVLNCLPVTDLSLEDVLLGAPSSITGRASFEYIRTAIDLTRAGVFSAMVTCPISKKGLELSGINFRGHTEILAQRTNTPDYLMMMAGERLKVTLVTIHCALRDVPGLLSKERVFKTIGITHRALVEDFGIKRPRLAVCGLNPHAGEGGMFGDEEERIIGPAIEMARNEGIKVDGPFPPDTIFYRAKEGAFDAVCCQYHDQGLIPFKLLHFRDGVNVTLGLPIVRTSVDHGTAYDIAGTGKADATSLISAIMLSERICHNRKGH